MMNNSSEVHQLSVGPLYFVSLGHAIYGGFVSAETINLDEETGACAVVAYLTRQEAYEATKRFPGSEVIEISKDTDPDWHYRRMTVAIQKGGRQIGFFALD